MASKQTDGGRDRAEPRDLGPGQPADEGAAAGIYTPVPPAGGTEPGATTSAEMGGGGVGGDIDLPGTTGRGSTEGLTHGGGPGGSYPRGMASEGSHAEPAGGQKDKHAPGGPSERTSS